jgi:tRNA A37 methylthiotransferase MiaB
MPSIYFTDDDMCTTQKLELKRIQDFFLANDWTVTREPEAADLLLCVTCAGWTKLEHNSLDRLSQLQGMPGKVVSYGCVNDIHPDKIQGIHSGLTISSKNKFDIEALIPNPKVALHEIAEPSAFRRKEDYRLYDLTKRYVNIAGGCSFKCTYCPHRVGLGRLKSRSAEDIVRQIEQLLKENVKIVVLTGMETAFYGMDIGTDYPNLIERVFEIDGTFEIHVAQFHPIGISKYSEELAPFFSNERLTDIQVPIQTTSDRLLKLMGRPPGVENIKPFMRHVKTHNRVAVLRTDIIVGFPTETMDELRATLAFATEIFDEIAVYGIEIQEGLPVEKLRDKAHSTAEIEKRIEYAISYISTKGKMPHGGQQSDVSLLEVEKEKEKLRAIKRSSAR